LRKQLFSETTGATKLEKLREIFKIETSVFWQSHYTFEKESRKKRKKLTDGFIDLLIINTVVPLMFCHAKFSGKLDAEKLFKLIRRIEVEKNSIISKFNQIRKATAKNAMDSQALIHLKKNYCDKNRCLQCGLGAKLLQT